ncbi:glycosyltransferase [Demequina rhizosphaerae]|uniref:glycosyltransferase n=1 Tax=Demequina rhizosphaerae TaxID=1638985 RepID=UPI0007864E64|nr:glycosyltransferase [Demequina rhizosphaerae]
MVKVLVLGNHPDSGWSMVRYSRLLERAYRDAGVEVELIQPSAELSRRARGRATRKLLAYVENLVTFPAAAYRASRTADVIHIADHSNALWLLGPLGGRTAVTTCHDLVAVRAARGEIPGVTVRGSGRLYQRAVHAGLERADLIKCVSEATASDVRRIVRATGVDVLLNPVSPELVEWAAGPGPGGGAALVVSTVGWRKRREHAIRIWKRLRAEAGMAHLGLRLVGPELTDHELALLDAEERAAVVILSGLTDEELAQEYGDATVLIQASQYEGFGWPILEANMHGTPALCADVPVFREVAGPAGTFVRDDLDAVDWPSTAAAVVAPGARDEARRNAERFHYGEYAVRLAGLAESVVARTPAPIDMRVVDQAA